MANLQQTLLSDIREEFLFYYSINESAIIKIFNCISGRRLWLPSKGENVWLIFWNACVWHCDQTRKAMNGLKYVLWNPHTGLIFCNALLYSCTHTPHFLGTVSTRLLKQIPNLRVQLPTLCVSKSTFGKDYLYNSRLGLAENPKNDSH